MLVKGDARARDPRRRKSARLRCSDHLKEIVYRCIGERRKRYEGADELIEALRNPPARAARPACCDRSKGVHLDVHRHPDAGRAATAVARRPARRRDRARRAVRADDRRRSRGRPNPLQAAGRDAGHQADGDQAACATKGHRITLLERRRSSGASRTGRGSGGSRAGDSQPDLSAP